MKYFVVTAVALVIGFAVYYFDFKSSPDSAHAAWKRAAVETETKERPAYFEETKWKPTATEIRAPAANETK
jgi:hypothetical protein